MGRWNFQAELNARHEAERAALVRRSEARARRNAPQITNEQFTSLDFWTSGQARLIGTRTVEDF